MIKVTRLMVSSTLLATFLATVASSPVTASASVSASAPRVLRAVALPVGAKTVGPVAPSVTMNFDLVLSLRDQAGFDAFATNVTNPRSPLYRHYLTRGQFAATFGATTGQVRGLRAQLAAHGLHVTSVSSNGLIAQVQASTAATNAFFHTSMMTVRLASGYVGWSNEVPVTIPATVAGVVSDVVGLSNLVKTANYARRPHLTTGLPSLGTPSHAAANVSSGAPSACAAAVQATQAGYGGITQSQVATAFGLPSLYGAGDYASGQSIAIFELEPFAMSDIASFEQCYFGHSQTNLISQTTVDGGAGVGSGSGESALDIENIAALAPGASIQVYTGPNNAYGPLDVYNQIVADDTAKVVSTSWGSCEAVMLNYEPSALTTEHLIFEEAAAQGQTVFSSSGDSGNDDCAGKSVSPTTPLLGVDDPAAQPYVVGVGGTTALTTTPNPSQQVWNNGASGGASGGGVSQIWAQPAWMSQQYDPTNGVTCGMQVACRTVPDVSAFADPQTGVTIYIGGQWTTIGGTSSAAPQWAAVLAEINASPSCAGSVQTSNGVGFAAPLLYGVAGTSTTYHGGFTDITAGNNDMFNANRGNYAATVGYDLATGLGSPNVTPYAGSPGPGLAQSLCLAAQGGSGLTVTGASPDVVTVAGGQTITITGKGFLTKGVHQVFFGATASPQFNVINDTTLTAQAPALANDTAQASLLGVTSGTGSEPITVLGGVNGQLISTPPSTGVVSVRVDLASASPVVVQVGPAGGHLAGGNVVRITGAGFTAATAVSFGDIPATSFQVLNDNMISAIAPPATNVHCALEPRGFSGLCQVEVVVTVASGASSAVAPLASPLTGQINLNALGLPTVTPSCHCEFLPSATEYDYSSAAITGVVNEATGTSTGNALGGDTVLVNGVGLNILSVNWVNFGPASVAASAVTSIPYFGADGRQLSVISPPLATPSPTRTTIPVSIDFEGGTSNTGSFTYLPQAFVTSLSTQVLPSAGGAPLTIHGAGLSMVTSLYLVAVGGGSNSSLTVASSNFTVLDDATIELPSPSASPGDYVIQVCDAGGICNATTAQDTSLTSDNVMVIAPGQEAITSVTDPLQGNRMATVSSTGHDPLLVQGVQLNPGSDHIYFVTTSGDIAALGSVVAQNAPVTDLGATSAYEIAAPQIAANIAPGYLMVIIVDNGVQTEPQIAGVVQYA